MQTGRAPATQSLMDTASAAKLTGQFAIAAALLAGAVMVLGLLGGDRLNGDEHNAIAFLTDDLWEYMSSFHYGHVIKLQVWLLHALFGDSFFWYRLPAALCGMATLVWLATYSIPGLPPNRVWQALVVLMLGANASFLYFARWGIPSYAETILASSLLIGMALTSVMRQQDTTSARWLVLVVILPWLYPATIILLGGVSAALLLQAWARQWLAGTTKGLGMASWRATLPVLLGLLSLAAYRLSVPDAHWNRARNLHKAFKAWSEGNRGSVVGFVQESLTRLASDFLTTTKLAADSSLHWVATAYSGIGKLLGLVILAAIAMVLLRVWRFRRELPGEDAAFLRGIALLLTTLLAVLAVTNIAAVFDVFPVGSLRHLFWTLPLLALAALLSLAYMAHAINAGLKRRAARAWGARVVGAAIVVGLGVALVHASLEQRRLADAKYAELLEILRAGDNSIVFNWAPGFYFAGDTLPGGARFFDENNPKMLPERLVRAIHDVQNTPEGGQLAVLTSSETLEVRNSPFSQVLMPEFDLQMDAEARYGNYRALSLRIPPKAERKQQRRQTRSIDVSIDLPPQNIVSIRLDPTPYLHATASVESLIYTNSKGDHAVDVCGDRAMMSMRVTRIGSGPGCTFIFGNEENSGWIGPSALKNLGVDAAPRRLRVRMSGELADEFSVYLDTGSGYRSPIRVKAGTR